MKDQVVITGVGMVSSLGLTAPETWDALLAGRSGIQPIKDFDAGGFDCRLAAQVHGLDPGALGIHPRDARIMDTHSFMLMKCARDAYREAALDASSFAGEEIGFFAGMGMVDYRIGDLLPAVRRSSDDRGNIDYDRFFSKGYQEIYPLWPLSLLNNISFCQVAISLDIRGENTVFSPHADSGAQAIAEAAEALLARKVKAILAGGVSGIVSPQSLARAHMSGELCAEDRDGEMKCRPFGSLRNGTVLGEGCAIVALELRSSAVSRGVTHGTKISGFGASFGVADRASGAIGRSMQRAIEQAGLRPEEIDVIIANGDGTIAGDRNEMEAIRTVFSKAMDALSVYSSKGALGHMHAGAPAADIILGSYMLGLGSIPPTLNAEPVDSDMQFSLVIGEPLMKKPERIMVNCQSPGGQCASLIIEAVC